MYPTLFQLPGIGAVGSYGVLVTLGALMAFACVWRDRDRLDVRPWRLAVALGGLMLASLLGSRLLWLWVSSYPPSLGEVLAFWRPGRVLYGGVLAVLVIGGPLSRALGLPLRPLADRLGLGALSGIAIGRLGCWLAGDDYGRLAEDASGAATVPWAVRYTDPAAPLPPELFGRWLHPTPLYLSLAAAALAGLLWLGRRRAPFPGAIFCGALLGHACLRFVLEELRGDAGRGALDLWGATLSTSQFLAVTFAFTAIALAWFWRRLDVAERAQRAPAGSAPARSRFLSRARR